MTRSQAVRLIATEVSLYLKCKDFLDDGDCIGCHMDTDAMLTKYGTFSQKEVDLVRKTALRLISRGVDILRNEPLLQEAP